jgi:hypothetical protein
MVTKKHSVKTREPGIPSTAPSRMFTLTYIPSYSPAAPFPAHPAYLGLLSLFRSLLVLIPHIQSHIGRHGHVFPEGQVGGMQPLTWTRCLLRDISLSCGRDWQLIGYHQGCPVMQEPNHGPGVLLKWWRRHHLGNFTLFLRASLTPYYSTIRDIRRLSPR